MNELSLNSNALAELHTGLANIIDGYNMPDMNFEGQVASMEENLDHAAGKLTTTPGLG